MAGGADQTLNTTAAFHEITNQRRGGAVGAVGPDVSMMDDHEPFKCKVPSKVFLNPKRERESKKKY